MGVRTQPRSARAALSLGLVWVLAAVPAPATAAVAIADFSVTPSTTRAGAHPGLAVGVAFDAAPPSDDARDLAVRLAPGLIADPGAADRCPAADFATDRCSARSRVGSVGVRAATLLGSLDAPGDVFNLAPSEDELARLGVWLRPLGPFAKQRLFLPVRLSAGEGYAVEVAARDLPRTVEAIAGVSEVPIRVEQLTLALDESIGGRPFLRNPTSCRAAVSRATARSWDVPEAASSQVSSFTPTGCGAQPFGARLSVSIGRGGGTAAGRLAALETRMRLAPGQAGLRRLKLSLPSDLGPNLAAATRACLPEALSSGTCPPQSRIGSARAASPLLPAPLDGAVLLGLEPSGLPKLAIALRGPPAITLEGSIRVVKRRIDVVFDELPDLPLTQFRLRIAGLLRANRDLCRRGAPLAVPAVLTAHNGRSLRFVTSPLAATCTGARARRR
jgi:hypothetical protein